MGIFGSGSKDTSRGSSSKVVKTAAITAEWRPVFLLCYPSAKFKAHWAIFVPELQDTRVRKGKLIHVVGNVREGFELEFKRNYDLSFTNNPPGTPIELGLAPTAYLLDTIGENVYATDSEPKDYFEEIIASVPAPSKSLNTVQRDSSSSGPPRRAKLSDCQWWVTRAVEALVEAGYLIPPQRGRNKGRSPTDILADAPRH